MTTAKKLSEEEEGAMKFFKGQRVRLTEPGRMMFPHMRIYGTVVNPYLEKDIIRVKSDGKKQVETWHIDFWKEVSK